MNVTLTLPQELQAHVEQEIKAGSHPGVVEYLIALVERDFQCKQAQHRLDDLLQEGLDSPAQEITPDYWNSLKASVTHSSPTRQEGRKQALAELIAIRTTLAKKQQGSADLLLAEVREERSAQMDAWFGQTL